MAPRSLVDTCLRTCIKNVSEVYSVGDLPYHLARPVLLKINNPDQLREIELSSSRIEGETEELWRRLIARKFPNWERKNYIPKNPNSWYKVYERYKREQDAEIAEAEAKLAATFGALKNQADSKKSTIVSQQLMPKLPKEGRGPGSRRVGLGRDVPDHLSWGGGTRTKVTTGRGVIKKAMREAREMANRRTLSTPSGQLRVPEGQIRKAPEALVHEYRVKQQAPIRIRPPKNKPKTEAQMAEDTARREKEARLLNIKKSSSARPEQVVSDSEGEYEDDGRGGGGGGGYLNDLFSDGEEDDNDVPPPSRKSTAAPNRAGPSSTSMNRPNGTSIGRKSASTLLSNSYNPATQRRVVRASTPPAAADPPRRSPQAPAASSAPSRHQAGPSSPPRMVLKRKPQTDIFMRKPKIARH